MVSYFPASNKSCSCLVPLVHCNVANTMQLGFAIDYHGFGSPREPHQLLRWLCT